MKLNGLELLSIVECEGHGRYFEVYEGGIGAEYRGTFSTAQEVCERFAGRAALIYTFDAYEAACAALIAADPVGWDTSDVVPPPYLARVMEVPLP